MLPTSLAVAKIEIISRLFFLSLFVGFIVFGKILVETHTFC